jgi:hypothetical protein
MSESSYVPDADGAFDDDTQPHHPRHRRDDVPLDAEPLLAPFGDNPDTSAAG